MGREEAIEMHILTFLHVCHRLKSKSILLLFKKKKILQIIYFRYGTKPLPTWPWWPWVHLLPKSCCLSLRSGPRASSLVILDPAPLSDQLLSTCSWSLVSVVTSSLTEKCVKSSTCVCSLLLLPGPYLLTSGCIWSSAYSHMVSKQKVIIKLSYWQIRNIARQTLDSVVNCRKSGAQTPLFWGAENILDAIKQWRTLWIRYIKLRKLSEIR